MPFAALFAAWMNLEMIILSEVRQKQVSYDIIYKWHLKKMIQMNLFTKQKQTHRYRREKKQWLPKGKVGRGINQKFWINQYTLLYITQINNKDLFYSTGNYIQYLLISYNGKEYEKVYIYIYVYVHMYN